MGPDLELFGLHKDGREFPVEIALSPLQASGGGLVVTAIRDVSERKRTEESLRMLTSQLLRMQDEERRHIARELHDSAGQILASLSMNLSALDGKLDAELKPRVSESVRLLDELSKQLRTISHLLHPPLLDELGLSSALRFYVEGFGERSKIATSLEIPEDLGGFRRMSKRLFSASCRSVLRISTGTPEAWSPISVFSATLVRFW